MHYADHGRDKNEPPNEKGGVPEVPPESRQQDFAFQSFAFGGEISSAQDKAVSLFRGPDDAASGQLQRLKDDYQSLFESDLLPLVDNGRSGPQLRRYSLEILACRRRDEFYELLVTIRDEQHRFLWPAFSGRGYPSHFSPREFCGLVMTVQDRRSTEKGKVLRVVPLLSTGLHEKELIRFENGDMDGVFGDCALWVIRRRCGFDTEVTKVEKAFDCSPNQSAFLVTDTLGKVHLISPRSDSEVLEKDLPFGSTLFDPLVALPTAGDAGPQLPMPAPGGAQIVSEFTQNHLKCGYELLPLEDLDPSAAALVSHIPPLLEQYFGDSWQRGWHIGLEGLLREPKDNHTLALIHVMDDGSEYRLPNKSGAHGVKYSLFAGIIIETAAHSQARVSGVCIPPPLLDAQLCCMLRKPGDSLLCVPLETAILGSMRQQGLNPEAISLSSVIPGVGPSMPLRAGPSDSELYSLLCTHNHGKHLVALHYHAASGALFFDYNLKVGMYFPAAPWRNCGARPRTK